MKVYTGKVDGVDGPFMVQVAAPVMNLHERLHVFLMKEEHTARAMMTIEEYNALDFYWFEMKEKAERPARTWDGQKSKPLS